MKLFGSLETGLALESSDMDIAVTGMMIPDRYDMIQKLKALGAKLKAWKYVKSHKVIDTASIPVIKLVNRIVFNILKGARPLTTQEGRVSQRFGEPHSRKLEIFTARHHF